MASTDTELKPPAKPLTLNAVDDLADYVQKIAIQTEDDDSESSESPDAAPRPFFSYSRPQILNLYKSPLVQVPEGMPELKEWFGDWNEQFTTKKDPDASTPATGRRFRRDAEDADSTTARAFRATLTQPSQMGNFRHQSTRNNDREKDLDKEKDRDRDAKDGLRSLSEKYDRDRLGLTGSGATRPRGGDRDAAPHLVTATAAGRLSTQPATPAGSRRAEPRDPTKRRNIESSDDWRRGAEPPRRDEKSDAYRRDREVRERPRSHSRPRRDTSTGRRDRDREDKDRDREREPRDREARGDRPVRGMDHYSPPREKDDDPRRWRDDGKRDERLATRRERDRDTRDRGGGYDNERDAPHDKGRDKDRDRWHTTEDRDSRLKRPAKGGRYAEDGKDKDDSREKEREKEKEPAWMETYVPNDAHAGILGGQSAEGELDSIQAWKKGMKEKEEKDKQNAASVTKEASGSTGTSDNPMDEIQLFKMLMKREAGNRESGPTDTAGEDSVLNGQSTVTPSAITPKASVDPPRSLLSLITSSTPDSNDTSGIPKVSAPPLEAQTSTSSRFFPNPKHADSISRKPSTDNVSSSPASEYYPPQSSRLLGLGSRTPSTSSVHPSKSQSSMAPTDGLSQQSIQHLHALQTELQSHSPDMQYRLRAESPFSANQMSPSVRQDQFSPFEHLGRGIPFDDMQQHNGPRRASGISSISSDSGSYVDINNGAGGFTGNGFDPASSTSGNFTNGKGSRFAKFFDNKGRDAPMGAITKPSPSPLQGHRQDVNRILMEQQGDGRSMEDLFAMLQSSSQGPVMSQAARMNMLSGNSYGQGMSLQHQQHGHNSRLDALYDSRFEDKSFVPDGMVPGLRTVPPTRSRDASNGYLPDHLDEQIPFGLNRPPQHRNGDMFNNNLAQLYPHQQGFVRNGPVQQQPPFRGNPSPIASQNPLLSQQRLPPGLANLGGRPPHDSSQFFGNNLPVQSAPQGNLHNGLSPQGYSNYQAGGIPFAGGPQMRGPSGQGHMQGVIGHNPLAGLGHPTNLDLRAANQAQLLGRGYSSQQLAHVQMQQLSLRQQQQQLSQNMGHLPHHLQQPPGVPGGHNQPTQDLMALLMGNNHRE